MKILLKNPRFSSLLRNKVRKKSRMKMHQRDAARREDPRLPGQKVLRVKRLTSKISKRIMASRSSRESELQDLMDSADHRARLNMAAVCLAKVSNCQDPTDQGVMALMVQGPKVLETVSAPNVISVLIVDNVEVSVVVVAVETRAHVAEEEMVAIQLQTTPMRL